MSMILILLKKNNHPAGTQLQYLNGYQITIEPPSGGQQKIHKIQRPQKEYFTGLYTCMLVPIDNFQVQDLVGGNSFPFINCA